MWGGAKNFTLTEKEKAEEIAEEFRQNMNSLHLSSRLE